MTPGRVATTNRLLAVLDSDEAAAAAVDALAAEEFAGDAVQVLGATGTPTGSTAWATSAGPGPGPGGCCRSPWPTRRSTWPCTWPPSATAHRAVGAGPRRRGQRGGPGAPWPGRSPS